MSRLDTPQLPPYNPLNPLPVHLVMMYFLDLRHTIDRWIDDIRVRAEYLESLGYEYMGYEEYRVRKVLFNLPVDPFWSAIRERYSIMLEDRTWNTRYIYNERWRLQLRRSEK